MVVEKTNLISNLSFQPPSCNNSVSVFLSEHIASIIAAMLRNCQATQRQRLVNKFTENDHEKVRLLMKKLLSYFMTDHHMMFESRS